MRDRKISTYSTKELLSKWASLAKFIVHYEGVEFDTAKQKALKLYKDKEKALAYIDSKRTGKPLPDPSKEEQQKIIPTTLPVNHSKINPKTKKDKKPIKRDLPSQNYQKLLKVAPCIEERLLDGQQVYGKSKVAGFMDFVLEWVHTEKEGVYHLAITHYQEMNGDLVPDPDMRVLMDINKLTLEPLSYQDFYKYQEVYEDMFNRNRIYPKLRSSLNQFLKTWLTNLINQGHKVSWKHDKEEVKIPKHEKSIKEKTERIESTKTEIKFGTPIIPSRKERAYEVRQLFEKVYTTLKRLLPKLNKKLRANEVDGLLVNKKDITYDLVPADPYNTTTYRFGINENEEDGISLIVSVNLRSKRAWLTFSDPDFIDDKAYKHEEGDLFSQEVEKANTFLLNWLKGLIKDKYKVKWNEEELAPNSPQKEGEVKLTNRHIKAGFKQKHIDWINKHKKGLVLVVRRSVINNTKDIFADLAKKAMRAGKRLSRTGVIYYEGRSNRADVTGRGI